MPSAVKATVVQFASKLQLVIAYSSGDARSRRAKDTRMTEAQYRRITLDKLFADLRAFALLRSSIGVLTLACVVGPLNGQVVPARRFVEPGPVLERTIGEGDDIVLYRPSGMVALSADLLSVFDWSEMQVRTFSSRTGRQVWSFGRRGNGPEEFSGGHDLAVGPSGVLSILDKVNNRLTKVSPSGRFVSSAKMPKSVRQLLPPMRGEELVVIPEDTVHIWEAINKVGEVTTSMLLPSGVHFSSNLAGESYGASFASGLAVAFRWSDVIVLLDTDGAIRKVIRGPERIEFPGTRSYSMDPARIKLEDPKIKIKSVSGSRIAPGSVEAVQAISGAGDRLFVLFNGAGPLAGRLVDQYDVLTGAYLGTYVLPSKAIEIAALGQNRIATIESDMVPVLKIWRLSPGPRGANGAGVRR